MRPVPGSRGAEEQGAIFRDGGHGRARRVLSAARQQEMRHVPTTGPQLLEVAALVLD